MTPKLSLIIGIAVTALAFGVPTAFGEGQLVGARRHVAYFYANERATLDFGPVIHDHGDATQAKSPMEVIRDHGDATQAKLLLQSPPWSSVITATRPRRSSCSSRPQWGSSVITATRPRRSSWSREAPALATATRSGSIPTPGHPDRVRELRLGDRVAPARNRLRAWDSARRGALAGDTDDEGRPLAH